MRLRRLAGARVQRRLARRLRRRSAAAGDAAARPRVQRDDPLLDLLLERHQERREFRVVQVRCGGKRLVAGIAGREAVRGDAGQTRLERRARLRRRKLGRAPHLLPAREERVQADARDDHIKHAARGVRVRVCLFRIAAAQAAPEQHAGQPGDVRRLGARQVRHHGQVRRRCQERAHGGRAPVQPRDEHAKQRGLRAFDASFRRDERALGGGAFGRGEVAAAAVPAVLRLAATALLLRRRARWRRARRRRQVPHQPGQQQLRGRPLVRRHLQRYGQQPGLRGAVAGQHVPQHARGAARDVQGVRRVPRGRRRAGRRVGAAIGAGSPHERARQQRAQGHVTAVTVAAAVRDGREGGDADALQLRVRPEAPREDALSSDALAGVGAENGDAHRR